jgi:hypothetical protein
MQAAVAYFINQDNAQELQRRATISRMAKKQAKLALVPEIAKPQPITTPDPLTTDLIRAMKETLADLRNAEQPKDRAMLAQALRNLRETYHLVTGQPRPGQIKSVAPRTRAQSYPSPEVIPEPIAIEAQVSSVPMVRPHAGCGVQTPTSSVPAPAPDRPTPQSQQ